MKSYLVIVALLTAGCAGRAPDPAPSSPPAVDAPDEGVAQPSHAGGQSDEPVQGAPSPMPPADAETSSSGLAWIVIRPGSGQTSPRTQDHVKVHYTGWTTDGTVFDSSYLRGQPATFPLDAVIKGWTEGVQMMVAGEKRRFWIPADLAYGDLKRAGVPTGTLIFDVELLDVERMPDPPEVPEDVAEPPEGAAVTPSGLASRVLQPGTGQRKPTEEDRVEVHYTGWTTDGRMFDSSVTRGRPSVFPLSAVIKGWTEGLQLMVEGEKRRFWIPAKLAYGENPRAGAPQGMLVFDVELLAIR